jgi:hypothetical protein
MQFPIWVWVVGTVGVITAGIGLGYLIIYLFWRIERYFTPKLAARKDIQLEEKIEKPAEEPEPVIEEKLEDESVEPPVQEVEEELTPVITGTIPSEQNRLVKFATVLNSKFNHPFTKANIIICWDIALEDGDEVWDAEGKQMNLRIIKPQSEIENQRYILMDETGQHTISIILGKEYLKRETKLDFDKIRMIR